MILLNKAALRKCTIEKLRNIPSDKKTTIEKQLQIILYSSQTWVDSQTIGITISKDFEWNTRPIIEQAWKLGKTVCVPKCYPKENKLIFYKLDSYEQLESSYNQLLEPKTTGTEQINKKRIDLLIVPGILFDKNGYRIGFGGGYYDRYLADYPNETVSLLTRAQLIEDLPVHSLDINVKQLITEQGVYKI
ncbi:MAG TPA: 5-formyltetrahydrofolate cyclo-ligase [Virgibacillus sp.]|nr:5-formyltetrahydrofolate cyclo-ligase [Virgibacillus sp.]